MKIKLCPFCPAQRCKTRKWTQEGETFYSLHGKIGAMTGKMYIGVACAMILANATSERQTERVRYRESERDRERENIPVPAASVVLRLPLHMLTAK